MKKLLIHSNNTSFNKPELFSISEQFVFDVDFDKDVDFYIDEILSEGDLNQKLKNLDVVFIKVSLSENYLEYLGLRLAYHIRLTKSLGNQSNLPIVFIAEESFQFLGLTYKEPSILFTRGIFLISEVFEDLQKVFRWFNNGKLKYLLDFNLFIDFITINPPANYESHHSIANEWSILRWSKVLGLSSQNKSLDRIKKNVLSLLYYKYLLAKYPIELVPNKSSFSFNGNGKILYIDDEWNKGWDVVLKEFVSSSPGAVLDILEYDYKDRTPEEILIECIKKVQDSNPDVVLLDLRLSDSDFSNSTKSQELTGYKVLAAIKTINPGIQVIIFTASNKVWNFTELQIAGSDDFILKESPILSMDYEYSKNAIGKLAFSLTEAFKMSFLKKAYLKMEEIESIIVGVNNEEENEFLIRLKTNLSIAFRLLVDTKKSSKYFNYAFLQLFQIIEDFSKLSSVFREGTDCYVNVKGQEVCVNKTLNDSWQTAISFTDKYKLVTKVFPIKEKRKRLDTNYIVSSILIFRLGYDNSSALNWTDIYTIRNTKAAHFNVEDLINEDDIYKILNFIKIFISPDKQKENNVHKGLKVKSFEESFELLKSHFNK